MLSRYIAMTTIGEEYLRPLGSELVRESPEDTDPVAVRHGLAHVPEIKELCAFLGEAGIKSGSSRARLEQTGDRNDDRAL